MTTFTQAMENFSDPNHDAVLADAVLAIDHLGDQPSQPADMNKALSHYDPDAEEQARVLRERGPRTLEKGKLAAKRVLAIAGVVVAGAGIGYAAPKVGEEVYNVMSQSEPVTRELTPSQKQNIVNDSFDTQPEVPGLQR